MSSAAELLDRAAELAALARAVDALAAGEPSLVEISGACGTGRSALLTHAVQLARAAGAVVLTTAGETPGRRHDHQGVDELMRQLATVDPGRAGDIAPAAVIAAVRELARGTPVLVAVDDADRLDDHTLAWLARLAVRADGRAIMVVAVTGATRHLLDGAEVLTTRPLPPEAVEALVSAACGERVAVTLSRRTGGVPSVVHAVLDALRANPSATEEEVAELAAEAFADLVVRATATMPAEANGLLRAIALCRPGAGFGLTCAVAGLRDIAPGRALDLLVGAGLVTRDHPPALSAGVCADRILAGMAQADRDELHVRAARLTHRDAVEESEVTRILDTTPPLGEPWVVPLLRTVAQKAVQRGEPRTAARHLERALREPLDPATRSGLVVELAAVESTWVPDTGDRRLARMLLEPQPPECGPARLAAADQLFGRGNASMALYVFGSAPSTGVERDSLNAMYWLITDAPYELPELGLLDVPPPPVAPDNPAHAGTAAWLCAARVGDPELARTLARTALTADATVRSPKMLACLVLALTDDLDEAFAGLDAIVAEARRHRLNAVVSHTLVFRAMLMVPAGRLAEAAADLDAARSALPPRCWHPDMRGLLTMVRIQLCLESGLVAEAEELSASVPDHQLGNGHNRTLMLFARAVLALRRGDAAAALALVRECGRRMHARGWLNPAMLQWRSVAAKALSVCGDAEGAARLCEEELALARAWAVPSVLGRAHLGRAAACGDPEDLREAVRLLRGSPRRLAYATALLDLAEITEAPAAEPLVREAAEIAVRGRAGALLGRARGLGWVPGG
ncbi:AAA family ATPase [Crossiella sp. NPDC003009]